MENTSQVYQVEQDEARKRGGEEWNITIHPAGGFDKTHKFVYEPIGGKKYIFKIGDYKGIGDAANIGEEVCKSCGNIIKVIHYGNETSKEAKCSCGRKFEIKTEWRLNLPEFPKRIIKFEGKPLEKVIFSVPSQSAIKFWLNNYLVKKDGTEITSLDVFNVVKSYLKAFYDLPVEIHYDMLSLSALQSWLHEILDVLFYVATAGETGSGKTALLEALMGICKHGLLASDIKTAGIARCSELFKLSLGLDEIDNKKSKEDEGNEGILRQGYRRGQLYIRMAPLTHEPQFFNVFGFKAFTFRSEIIDDLQNRSIDVPIHRTNNQVLPIINLFKQHYSPFELVFFWYMDNIAKLYMQSPGFTREQESIEKELNELNQEKVNDVNEVNIVNVVNVNSNIYKGLIERDTATRETPYLLNCINLINKKPIFGRNVEITYLIYSLSQILGLDIESILLSTMEQKQEMEEASQEEGWIGLLKDILVEEFKNAEYKEGIRVVSYRKISNKYLYRMRDLYGNVPTEYNVSRMLRQIGFVNGINRKVVRIEGGPRLSLIYDNQIKKSLGIEFKEIKTEKIIKEERGNGIADETIEEKEPLSPEPPDPKTPHDFETAFDLMEEKGEPMQ